MNVIKKLNVIDNVEVTYGVKDRPKNNGLVKMSAAEAKAFMKTMKDGDKKIKPIVETTAKRKPDMIDLLQSTCNLQKKEYPMRNLFSKSASPAFRKRSTLIITRRAKSRHGTNQPIQS
ncbi:hypothetical protein SPFM1_00157 [Salmonella phage SPFM1]|nr:hypothetical protein SPFM1_00157 [Salmonella phage SPFM1]